MRIVKDGKLWCSSRGKAELLILRISTRKQRKVSSGMGNMTANCTILTLCLSIVVLSLRQGRRHISQREWRRESLITLQNLSLRILTLLEK